MNGIKTLLLLLLPVSGMCQIPVFNEAEMVKLAGEKNAVVLNRTEKLTVEIQKGKPEIFIEYSEHILYLNDKGTVGNERVIPYYEKFYALDNVEACTYVPEGTSYKKVKADEPQRFSHISADLFYDDVMQAKVIFPAIQNRAISELKYRYHIKDPLFTFPFYFIPGFSIPIRESIIHISYPSYTDLEIRMFGDTSGVKTTVVKEKNTTLITKRMDNIQPEKDYENSTTRAYFSPHLYYMLKSYTVKGSTTHISGTVEDLYRNNYRFIRDLNKETVSRDIKQLADSLKATTTAGDTIALIEKVYYWVQDHIRYIAIEDGFAGYIPRASNGVFEKRYGDCKDKAALLQSLLKECGIVSHLCWIGTRHIPYTYSQLPLLASSNHMITAKKIAGEWMFFDPTAEHLPIGFPSVDIQGKEAMISIDENKFEVIRIPEVAVERNFVSDTLSMHLNETNLLEINGKLNFGGFSRYRFISLYSQLNEKDREEFVHNYLKHNFNKAKIIDYKVSGNDDIHSQISISYKIELPHYASQIDKNFYLNLYLNKPMMNEQVKDDGRKVPVDYLFRYTNSLQVNLELPEGYISKELPSKQEYSSDLLSFTRIYTQTPKSISMSSLVKVNSMQVSPDQFAEWNKGINLLNKTFKESITILPKP